MSEQNQGSGETRALSKIAFKPMGQQLAIPPEWLAGQADGSFITTLDTESPEGKRQLMLAMNSEVANIDTTLNVPIDVTGFTLHPASKADEQTGEITRLTRMVLHCLDGKYYECFSDGALKSLRMYLALFGDKAFNTPARCKPVRVATSGNRSMYRLEWEV